MCQTHLRVTSRLLLFGVASTFTFTSAASRGGQSSFTNASDFEDLDDDYVRAFIGLNPNFDYANLNQVTHPSMYGNEYHQEIAPVPQNLQGYQNTPTQQHGGSYANQFGQTVHPGQGSRSLTNSVFEDVPSSYLTTSLPAGFVPSPTTASAYDAYPSGFGYSVPLSDRQPYIGDSSRSQQTEHKGLTDWSSADIGHPSSYGYSVPFSNQQSYVGDTSRFQQTEQQGLEVWSPADNRQPSNYRYSVPSSDPLPYVENSLRHHQTEQQGFVDWSLTNQERASSFGHTIPGSSDIGQQYFFQSGQHLTGESSTSQIPERDLTNWNQVDRGSSPAEYRGNQSIQYYAGDSSTLEQLGHRDSASWNQDGGAGVFGRSSNFIHDNSFTQSGYPAVYGESLHNIMNQNAFSTNTQNHQSPATVLAAKRSEILLDPPGPAIEGCKINVRSLPQTHGIILETDEDKIIDIIHPAPDGTIQIKENQDIRIACNGGSDLIYIRSKPNFINLRCLKNEFRLITNKRRTRVDENLKIEPDHFRCTEEPKGFLNIVYTNIENENYYTECGGENNVLYEMRFTLKNNKSIPVYDVCMNREKYRIHYAKKKMDNSLLARQTYEIEDNCYVKEYSVFKNYAYVDSLYEFPIYSEQLFNQLMKSHDMYNVLTSNGAYSIKRGQLFGKNDFVYRSEQLTCCFYVNVQPMWTSLGDGNWNIVEDAIRLLAINRETPLTVYSGTLGDQHFYVSQNNPVKLYMKKDMMDSDGDGVGVLTIPAYFFKIVSSDSTNECVAIVGHNTHLANVAKVCTVDVTNQIDWLKDFLLPGVENGLTYACHCAAVQRQTEFLPIFQRNLLKIA